MCVCIVKEKPENIKLLKVDDMTVFIHCLLMSNFITKINLTPPSCKIFVFALVLSVSKIDFRVFSYQIDCKIIIQISGLTPGWLKASVYERKTYLWVKI